MSGRATSRTGAARRLAVRSSAVMAGLGLAVGLAALAMAAHAVGPRAASGLPDRVIVFGDSLSDAGVYGWRFTTMPGLTFAQRLAIHCHQSSRSNERLSDYALAYRGQPADGHPGGLNYAEGGARANHAYSATSATRDGVPISAAVQLDHFLAQHRRFAPRDLATLFIGTNDVAYDFDPAIDAVLAAQLRADHPPSAPAMAAEQARVKTAADDVAAIARRALAHGARQLVVFKLFDMGEMPWFRTAAARTFASRLSGVFNDELSVSLPCDRRLLLIDTRRFLDDLLARRRALGFAHGANDDACALDDQDFCLPNAMKSPDADQTYVFAAGEHLTTHAHRLLADYVLARVRGRWQQSSRNAHHHQDTAGAADPQPSRFPPGDHRARK